MIKSILKWLLPPKNQTQKNERNLIQKESAIGATLFGPVPASRRREFFCMDEQTWVWYEEWTDQFGHKQAITTHYEVHGDRVLKIQNSGVPQQVSGIELQNLAEATRQYYWRVAKEVYHQA